MLQERGKGEKLEVFDRARVGAHSLTGVEHDSRIMFERAKQPAPVFLVRFGHIRGRPLEHDDTSAVLLRIMCPLAGDRPRQPCVCPSTANVLKRRQPAPLAGALPSRC